MVTTFIQINTGMRLGSLDRQYIDQLRAAVEGIKRQKAVMETQIDASDYSLVESQHGLQAGKGQTLYNLIAGADTVLSNSAITQLLNWCG